MVFPIAGGTQDTGYEISNSLRLNDDDSPKLTFTPSSAVTSERKTFTISCWVKRGSNFGTNSFLWEMGGNDNANERIIARFDTNNRLNVNDSSTAFRIPNRVFRDPSAWYHIVVAFDTTDSTADNRVKVYINGVQETSFLTSNNPGQNDTKGFSHNSEHTIARTGIDNCFSFDGYMTEFHALGGSQLDATSFGEFNDNGVWIPKKYTGTYGTNGFYLEFQQTGTSQNSSGIGADTSGNDNHFAVTNLAATDVTEDTCTNNFAVCNVLSGKNTSDLTTGNHATNDGAAGSATGTIAPTNGKWYFEITLSGSANFAAGVVNLDDWPSGTDIYNYGAAAAVSIENNANYNITYGNTAASPSTLQTGTQLLNAKYGFAMDIDNNDLYVSANGNWYTGSAFDNTSFSSASAVTTDLPSNVPLTAFIRNPDTGSARCNFGNPAGADTISSGNADANGYGNFEYAVPSGYYSLCTKNLAEYG